MIEALEKLKEWSRCCDCGWLLANGNYAVTDGHKPAGAFKNIGESLRELADVIQAEIDEYHMRLPVDAEGVPIRVGDEVYRPDDGEVRTVDAVGVESFVAWNSFDGQFCKHSANRWNHNKSRTIEDVLLDLVNDTARQGHQIGLTAHEIVAKYADEIRGMAGDAR